MCFDRVWNGSVWLAAGVFGLLSEWCMCVLSQTADWFQPPSQQLIGWLLSVPVASPLYSSPFICQMYFKMAAITLSLVVLGSREEGSLIFMLRQSFCWFFILISKQKLKHSALTGHPIHISSHRSLILPALFLTASHCRYIHQCICWGNLFIKEDLRKTTVGKWIMERGFALWFYESGWKKKQTHSSLHSAQGNHIMLQYLSCHLTAGLFWVLNLLASFLRWCSLSMWVSSGCFLPQSKDTQVNWRF